MAIHVQCSCGQWLRTPEEYAGKRAECPSCGRVFQLPLVSPKVPPDAAQGQRPPEAPPAADVKDFLDPPSTPPVKPRTQRVSLRAMFMALLDPRSIQWMLILGGGLVVLGIVVWLTSLGIFERRVVMAVGMATGTLAMLASGWFVVLRTRYKVAGQALTFLACVVAPLNLWFLHAQHLVTLDNHLWLGGVVCSLVFVVTVYVLRDPLFLYAVEAGVTLTVALFLGELHLVRDTSYLCMVLMILGLVSIHAERAFPPDAGTFTRRRFGMPLFWSGQAQAGAALILLLTTQVAGWLVDPAHRFLEWTWTGNWLTQYYVLAGGLWLAGTYLYLYSDLVVRRVGVYCYLAAFCLVMAEVTVVGVRLEAEGLIAVLAITALAINAAHKFLGTTGERFQRSVPPLALGLSVLPVLMGMVLHFRATSVIAQQYHWTYPTGWLFVASMLLATVGNRASAHLLRRTNPRFSAAYFFLAAAAMVVAAAGSLRALGLSAWSEQAPWLMLLPIGYLLAARLWRGHSPERPLGWVAHAAAAVILVHVLVGSLEVIGSVVSPIQKNSLNLLLGLVFAEAALFYTLAAVIRRRSLNVYFAALAACGALWQFLGYQGIPGPYYAMLYSGLGVALLALARFLGIEQIEVYGSLGEKGRATRGRGLAASQTGNAIVALAVLAAALQGLMHLASDSTGWTSLWAMVLTALACLVASALSLRGAWRRAYLTGAVALGGVIFLTLNVLVHLNGWEKLEIFCVAVGLVLIVVGYVSRFREEPESRDEAVSLVLWMGSVLATLPLLIAVVAHRLPAMSLSLPDELGLLTVTVLMLVTGYSWQIKSTTLLGGSTLGLYLVMIVVSLGWQQQMAIGVYLAIGGGLLFALGVGLSVYREKLLRLPEQMAKREGVFRMLNWR